MRLGSSDLDVLEAFSDIAGTGNISGPYRGQGSKTPEHYKLMYYWNAGKITDIRELLDKFWPYLSCRRKEQAEKILAQYDSYPRMPQRANTRYKLEGGDV